MSRFHLFNSTGRFACDCDLQSCLASARSYFVKSILNSGQIVCSMLWPLLAEINQAICFTLPQA